MDKQQLDFYNWITQYNNKEKNESESDYKKKQEDIIAKMREQLIQRNSGDSNYTFAYTSGIVDINNCSFQILCNINGNMPLKDNDDSEISSDSYYKGC